MVALCSATALMYGTKMAIDRWHYGDPTLTNLAKTISRATIAITGGPSAGTHAVYPVWPDLVRMKTTPEEGLSGDSYDAVAAIVFEFEETRWPK